MAVRISGNRTVPLGGRLLSVAALLTALTAMPGLERGSTVWERRDGPFFSRAVLWPPAKFTAPNLRSFYGELAQQMKGYRGWDVEVFVDPGDLTRETHGKMATDEGYEWWQELYDKFGHSLLPMAEFFGHEDNAVMRVRDSAGVCSEVTLAGYDFLQVQADGTTFEILKIYYHPLPPNSKPVPGDEAMISVYVRASRFPSVDQARDLSRTLQQRFRQGRVMLVIRTDSYFITDGAFPILYRFDGKPAPPSLEEYKQSKTMYCFCDRPGILCRAGAL
jgi:hypothetical protein